MGNVGVREGRCKQVGKGSKELQEPRLKAPLFAGGDEALTDKRAGGSSRRVEPSLSFQAGK